MVGGWGGRGLGVGQQVPGPQCGCCRVGRGRGWVPWEGGGGGGGSILGSPPIPAASSGLVSQCAVCIRALVAANCLTQQA